MYVQCIQFFNENFSIVLTSKKKKKKLHNFIYSKDIMFFNVEHKK